MHIELKDYDPAWPLRFAQEKEILEEVLRDYLVGSVEHIGSTSVVGMRAKPTVDMMLGVQDLNQKDAIVSLLSANDYCYFPYKPDVMHWFCKPNPESRLFHLHVVPFNSLLWKERLKFRDALRESSELAAQYLELKESLAEKYKTDREAYTDNKGSFIQRVLHVME